MKKIIYIILGLVLLVAITISALYNDKSKLSESVDDSNNIISTIKNDTAIKGGDFIKIDAAHYASGKVSTSFDGANYNINFENNFSSANGPDLYVYLSEKQEYKNIAVGGVDTSKTLNIGKLKNISGVQNYKVSKEEFEKYSDSVIIWCKDFGIQFSRADLK
jgi:ABC-type antimicrobial peptide transport system permease subunit